MFEDPFDRINELEDQVAAVSDALETALLWIELTASVADTDAQAFVQESRKLL